MLTKLFQLFSEGSLLKRTLLHVGTLVANPNVAVTFDGGDPHAVRRFVISRFFRLYPAYWLSLTAALVVLVVAAHQHVDAREVAANVTVLQQFIGIENVLGIYWTLQIELIFYALCVGLFIIGLLQKTSTSA